MCTQNAIRTLAGRNPCLHLIVMMISSGFLTQTKNMWDNITCISKLIPYSISVFSIFLSYIKSCFLAVVLKWLSLPMKVLCRWTVVWNNSESKLRVKMALKNLVIPFSFNPKGPISCPRHPSKISKGHLLG